MDRPGTRRGYWTKIEVRSSLESTIEDGEEDHGAPQGEEEVEGHEQPDDFVPSALDASEKVQPAVADFWRAHGEGFKEMWNQLSGQDRMNLIMVTVPHMPLSPKGSECACQSVWGRPCMYAPGMAAAMHRLWQERPEFNIEGLIGGHPGTDEVDLCKLFELWSESGQDLDYVRSMATLDLRARLGRPTPDPRAEEHMVLNSIEALGGKRGDRLTIRRNEDPQAVEGSFESMKRLAGMGLFVTIEEWNLIVDRESNILLLLAGVADEYLREWAGLQVFLKTLTLHPRPHHSKPSKPRTPSTLNLGKPSTLIPNP